MQRERRHRRVCREYFMLSLSALFGRSATVIKCGRCERERTEALFRSFACATSGYKVSTESMRARSALICVSLYKSRLVAEKRVRWHLVIESSARVYMTRTLILKKKGAARALHSSESVDESVQFICALTDSVTSLQMQWIRQEQLAVLSHCTAIFSRWTVRDGAIV